MSRATVPVAIAFVLLAATFALPAQAARPESCKPGDVFRNDDTRVWFHGMKDFFKVFDTNGSDEAGHYQYQTSALEERDASGNVVASMNLASAFPQTSSCTVTHEGEFVNMSLIVTDGLTGHAGTATVGFTFHFNTSSHGGKFDLDVQDWPWTAGDDHALDFAFSLKSDQWTAETASDGVGFRDGNGTSHGYVSWAPSATARYADGHEETANVNATWSAHGGEADVTLHFLDATPGYAELVYDPWMGSGDYVIVAGHLVGLAPAEDLLPRQLRVLL